MPNAQDQPVISIDGTSASGKSTLSEQLAQDLDGIRLEYSLVFRAIALHMLAQGFDPDPGLPPDAAQKHQAAEYSRSLSDISWEVFTKDISGHPDLRHIVTSRTAPFFSGLPEVLAHTDAAFIHLISLSPRPVVAEGRTIGRYVYPQAEVKFFVDATLYCRAQRRHATLTGKGRSEAFETVLADLARRDHQDQTRAFQPTGFDPRIQYWLDTTTQTIDETLHEAKQHINDMLPKPLFVIQH